MFPTDVVIVAGARTPMARYTGAFSDVSAIDLAAHASKEATATEANASSKNGGLTAPRNLLKNAEKSGEARVVMLK